MTTTVADRQSWVVILDGFLTLHGSTNAWLARQIRKDQSVLSRLRSGKPNGGAMYHLTVRIQEDIGAVFQVPAPVIFGPYADPSGILELILGYRRLEWHWLVTSLFHHGLRDWGLDGHLPLYDSAICADIGASAGGWGPVVRAAVSRLLWVPVGAIWRD